MRRWGRHAAPRVCTLVSRITKMLSRISFKLALIIGISLAGMLVMGPIALYTMRAQMMTDRQAKTQHMVDIGYGILAHYQKLESDGKMSKADAQAAAMNEIRSLRYDKVEYFWINDMSPRSEERRVGKECRTEGRSS